MRRIALWGFALNAIWEFGQAGPLYDMWDEVPVSEGLFHIALAIMGDVIIVLVVVGASARFVGPLHVLKATRKACAAVIVLAFPAAVVLEWIPRQLSWWSYNEYMPTITVFGETVGLAPVAQITVLPALSMFLAARIHGDSRRKVGARQNDPTTPPNVR